MPSQRKVRSHWIIRAPGETKNDLDPNAAHKSSYVTSDELLREIAYRTSKKQLTLKRQLTLVKICKYLHANDLTKKDVCPWWI